jgi:hypothetical protein
VLPLYHSSKASGHLATCARSIRLQDSLAKWPMCLPGQELQPCMRCVGKRDSPNQSSLGTGRDTVLDTVLDAPLIERGPRDGWAVRVLVRTVDVASLRGSEEQEVGRPQRVPGADRGPEAGGPTRRCRPVGVRGSVQLVPCITATCTTFKSLGGWAQVTLSTNSFDAICCVGVLCMNTT